MILGLKCLARGLQFYADMKQLPLILIWAISALIFLTAFKVSAAETRILFFYQDGCHWCAQMDTILREPKMERLLRGQAKLIRINVHGRGQINALGQSGVRATKEFKIYGTPTIIFMSAENKVLLRIPGALSRQDFWDLICLYIPGVRSAKVCREVVGTL